MGCSASTVSAQPEYVSERGLSSSKSEDNSNNSNSNKDQDLRTLPELISTLEINTRSGAGLEQGIQSLVDLGEQRSALAKFQDPDIRFQPLMNEHAKFLIHFVSTFQESGFVRKHSSKHHDAAIRKPEMTAKQFKSHTMDNRRVRKMCDELLFLEDRSHKMADDTGKQTGWMRVLQVGISNATSVNCIKMSNNPDVKIGGYFIISQMLGYVRGLLSLDLSSNELKGAEARVLALGLKFNSSLQELRLKENNIGSEGATSLAEALKVNSTLMLLDLRMNNIRGPGMCVLTDAMAGNKSLTALDLRWNYAGESSDYVEQALLDLERFCGRNREKSLKDLYRKMAAIESNNDSKQESNSEGVSEASTEHSLPATSSANGHSKPIYGESPRTTRVGRAPGSSSSRFMSLNSELDTSLDEDAIIGRLEVTILAAKNLPQVIWTSGKDGEFLGLPQAYCVFQLTSQKEQTPIMRKDWNPFWNTTFQMDVRNVWNVCKVKVMHSKTVSRVHMDDSTIGTVNLPVGAVINWKGVSKSSDGTWRACRRVTEANHKGAVYQICEGKDRQQKDTDAFESAELAARAYDETLSTELEKKGKKAEQPGLNFSGDAEYIGQHVKEDLFPLSGEDGVEVIGVQAGVPSTVRMRLKYFDVQTSYLEINLERASSLPKMDAMGSCDAYVKLIVGDYHFRSRVVRNSLDPEFNQTFRIAWLQDELLDLRVELWDWDRASDDDHMGDILIPLTKDKVRNRSLNRGHDVAIVGEQDNLVNAKGEKSIIHLRFTYFSALGQEPVKQAMMFI